MTEQEVSTTIALDEAIPTQTANGEVQLNEKCQIFVRDLKVRVWAHMLPDTVAVLSPGLLVEEFCFSYIWNPGRSPTLRNGNLTVRCHPTDNVPFICPGVSPEAGDVSKASGDREQWEQVGTEDEPPDLCETDSDEDGKGKWQKSSKNGKAKKEEEEEEEEEEDDGRTASSVASLAAPT